ncbi:MAG: LiaF domain-containing protein [Bacteroidales bacterium]
MNNFRNKRGDGGGTNFIALLFIVVGVVVLGGNLGLFSPYLIKVLFSWQMLFLLLGLYAIRKGNLTTGAVLILAGVLFILPRLFTLGAYWLSKWWPILIVVVGLGIIYNRKRWRHSKDGVESVNYETLYSSVDGFINSDLSFGSVSHKVGDQYFKGAKVKNNFGETIIDLRETSLESNNTVIDIDCNFGSVKIYLPLNWSVDFRVRQFFGSSEDRRRIGIEEQEQTKRIVVRGNISFGSVEILG